MIFLKLSSLQFEYVNSLCVLISLYRLTLEGGIIFHIVKHLIHICRPGGGQGLVELEVKIWRGQGERSEDKTKPTRFLSQFSDCSEVYIH